MKNQIIKEEEIKIEEKGNIMPAAVLCGRKRSSYYFSDEHDFTSSSKRLRFSTNSASASASGFLHLKSLFPHTSPQLLEKALEECGDDLDYAVKRLRELEHVEQDSGSDQQVVAADIEQVTLIDDGDAAASGNATAPSNLPADGTEWVDLLVREMMSATSVDDARARASRVLEGLEKSISARAAEESAECCQKENMLMKEKIQVLIRENIILKKAVAIQHERQKEFDEKNRELQHLKQLVSRYQEELRTLEVHNYALMMHLRQAQQSSHITGHFPPDVF